MSYCTIIHFQGYLGSVDDATELIKTYKGPRVLILIDQVRKKNGFSDMSRNENKLLLLFRNYTAVLVSQISGNFCVKFKNCFFMAPRTGSSRSS